MCEQCGQDGCKCDVGMYEAREIAVVGGTMLNVELQPTPMITLSPPVKTIDREDAPEVSDVDEMKIDCLPKVTTLYLVEHSAGHQDIVFTIQVNGKELSYQLEVRDTGMKLLAVVRPKELQAVSFDEHPSFGQPENR